MWLLSLIPTSLLDFMIHLVILIGAVGFIISFFITSKLLPVQKIVLQVVSILLIVLGVYWKGGVDVEKEWRLKVEAAEERAKVAEEKAAATNAQIKYVFLDRVKNVKDVQVIVQERIRDISVKIDEQCKVIPEVIDIHNQSAQGKVKK